MGMPAGMVGALCNNAIGVCGVNQAVKVMGCKFLDGSGNGYTSDAGAAHCVCQAVKILMPTAPLRLSAQCAVHIRITQHE